MKRIEDMNPGELLVREICKKRRLNMNNYSGTGTPFIGFSASFNDLDVLENNVPGTWMADKYPDRFGEKSDIRWTITGYKAVIIFAQDILYDLLGHMWRERLARWEQESADI